MLGLFVPFYRGIPYLERTLRSALAQTSSQWQLLVVDDCGPDDGAEALVARLADPRIRYRRNEANLGLAGNWNRCLDLAETPLYALLHADDELLPRYVETMLAAAERHPEVAAFFCGAQIIGAAGRPVFSFPDAFKKLLIPQRQGDVVLRSEDGVRALLRGNFIMCPTLCYRRSLIGSARFQTHRKQVPDLEFTTRLLLAGQTLLGLPDVAYAYRRHAANTTAVQTASLLRFEEEVELYDELARESAGRGWHRAARTGRGKTIIKLNLAYCIVLDLVRLRFGATITKARYLGRLL